jgi:hypothetical protein
LWSKKDKGLQQALLLAFVWGASVIRKNMNVKVGVVITGDDNNLWGLECHLCTILETRTTGVAHEMDTILDVRLHNQREWLQSFVKTKREQRKLQK